MAEPIKPIPVDDLVAATADGVLRALEARQVGEARAKAIDFVRDGFFVDIRIIAGGYPVDVLRGGIERPVGPALAREGTK
jgi:hypothetical protein